MQTHGAWDSIIYSVLSSTSETQNSFELYFGGAETAHIGPPSTSGYGRGKRGEFYVVASIVLY